MDKDISIRADRNLIESIKTRATNLYDGDFIEEEDYFIFTVGKEAEDGHLNGLVCLNDDKYEEILKRADKFFRNKGLNYVIWVRGEENKRLEGHLREGGYTPKREPGSAAMVIDRKIEGRSIDGKYTQRKVESQSDREDFSKVVAEAFEKDLGIANHMFSHPETLNSESTISYIIYKGDKPVGCASTVISGQTAGVYWIGVIEEERGEGLGAYLVQLSTNAGFDNGAKEVILQASKMGEPIYEKLGYRTFKYYRWYIMEN